jgi:hypothetical protein
VHFPRQTRSTTAHLSFSPASLSSANSLSQVALGVMDSVFLFFAVLVLRSLLADAQTPSFRIRIFSDLRRVVYLFQILGCAFDASLMPILYSGRPPTILESKSILQLPLGDDFFSDEWGVYIVVLKKSGCRPILYVGSSVNSQDGLFARRRTGHSPKSKPHLIQGKKSKQVCRLH